MKGLVNYAKNWKKKICLEFKNHHRRRTEQIVEKMFKYL
jgi:hypothetical protein